jgi:hypothetical protein
MALREAGFAVREGGKAGLPFSLLDAQGRGLSIDGESVWAFEYQTNNALDDARAAISSRGDEIPTEGGGTALINWTNPPLFFGTGRLLVVYSGDDSRTLSVLNQLLGKPFAGGFY